MNAKSWVAVAAIVTAEAVLPRMAAGEEVGHEAKRPPITVELDRAPLKIDAAQLRLAVGESVRAALVEAERAARSARQIEVARAAPRHGG